MATETTNDSESIEIENERNRKAKEEENEVQNLENEKAKSIYKRRIINISLLNKILSSSSSHGVWHHPGDHRTFAGHLHFGDAGRGCAAAHPDRAEERACQAICKAACDGQRGAGFPRGCPARRREKGH